MLHLIKDLEHFKIGAIKCRAISEYQNQTGVEIRQESRELYDFCCIVFALLLRGIYVVGYDQEWQCLLVGGLLGLLLNLGVVRVSEHLDGLGVSNEDSAVVKLCKVSESFSPPLREA